MKIEEGAYKKKGAAESVEQEKKDLGKMAGDEKQMDSAPARKKGGAKHIDGKEHTAKELKADGKALKQEARDKKKADKKESRATKKSERKSNRSKRLQKKIELQTLKKSQTDDTVIKGKKSNRITNLGKRKAKADKGTDREVEAGVAKKKGAAQYMKEGATDHKEGHKGGGKKKGAAEYSVELGPHPDSPKHGKHGGGGRKAGAAMGFTQNFGPARQNSYARGAAKVAQIMGKGAFKKKGAADPQDVEHSHEAKAALIKPSQPLTSISQDESDRIFSPKSTTNPNANTDAFIKQANNYGNRLDFTQSPTEVMNRAVNVYSNSENDFVRNSQGYGYGSKNLSKHQLKSLYGKYKDPNYKQKKTNSNLSTKGFSITPGF